MRKCIYFKSEEEYELTKLFLERHRFQKKLSKSGLVESDLDIGESSVEPIPEPEPVEESEDLPFVCKRYYKCGYTKAQCLEWHRRWKEEVNAQSLVPEGEPVPVIDQDSIMSQVVADGF